MAFLRRVLREPLLAFLLIGGALFVVFDAMQEPPRPAQGNEIVVSPALASRLAEQYRAIWRRPPTPAQMAGLIANHVREEVLLREAARLSLGQGDPVIRQRLVQKMDFLLESAASARAPSEEELRRHFEANADDYTPPPLIGFEQVFLGPSAGAAEVGAALTALRGGADPLEIGQRILLPHSMPASPLQAVDGPFGSGFFEQLQRIPGGGWQGPVTSGFGTHLVRITERDVPARPEFEAVREEVERDWRQHNARTAAQARYERLREGYTVTTPGPEEIAAILR